MCGCEDLKGYPRIIEEKDRTVIIYSDKEAVNKEKDEGVLIYYSSSGEVVKIVIPKDDEYITINL